MLRSTRQVSETHESGVYLNRMIHQWYPAQYGGQIPDQMLNRWSETCFFKARIFLRKVFLTLKTWILCTEIKHYEKKSGA